MNLFITLFSLSAAMAIFAAASNLEASAETTGDLQSDIALSDIPETTNPLRGMSRFLAQQKLIANMTCDKFPRICRLKSSPGPDRCKKKCVNVKTDRLKCGSCGYKCKYTEICCKGNCVNASFDKRHCGGCNKNCKKGEYCAYGMCNYA